MGLAGRPKIMGKKELTWTWAGAALHLLAADGSEPGRPAGARDRPALQDGPAQVRGNGPQLDPEVRHGLSPTLPTHPISPAAHRSLVCTFFKENQLKK